MSGEQATGDGDQVADSTGLQELLAAVADGRLTVDDALDELVDLPFADLGDLRLDHHRELRTGLPEVVLATGKSPAACARAAAELADRGRGPVLVTRADEQQAAAVSEAVPGSRYRSDARVVVVRQAAGTSTVAGRVAVVSAGTSDLPVARECAATLEAFAVDVTVVADVGVAGVHRLLAFRDELDEADVVVVVAGMEGALPTLVAGLVAGPVIAVPTSVGYGASFDGLAALLGMLASCSPGITVVNIDNGFGAAAAAVRILQATCSVREH